jgi:hypothetical protein
MGVGKQVCIYDVLGFPASPFCTLPAGNLLFEKLLIDEIGT